MMAVIFAFSSIPSQEMPNFGGVDFSVKKFGHMLGYALLGRSYLWGLGVDRSNARWWAWGLAVIYALTDEFHQMLVPGRNPWLVDIIVDGLGAFLGVYPFRRHRR